MISWIWLICCNSESDRPGLSHRCCHSLCQAACHGAGPLGDMFIFHLEILCILEENLMKILSGGSDWQREFQCYGYCKGKSYCHLAATIFRRVSGMNLMLHSLLHAGLEVFFQVSQSHFGMSRCWMWDVFQFVESWESFKLRWPMNLTSSKPFNRSIKSRKKKNRSMSFHHFFAS